MGICGPNGVLKLSRSGSMPPRKNLKRTCSYPYFKLGYGDVASSSHLALQRRFYKTHFAHFFNALNAGF